MKGAGTARRHSQVGAQATLDPGGCLITANQAAEALLGVSLGGGIGRPLVELLEPSASEQSRELSSLLLQVPTAEGAHRFEVALGGEAEVTRWIELLVTPAGNPPGSTVWLEDVTESKAAAATTQRRISLMQRAEQVAEIGSWEWVPGNPEMEWSDNLYRLLGLEPGAITPTVDFFMEQVHPDDRLRIERVAAFLGEEGYLAPVDYRVLQPGGPMRRHRTTITAVDRVDGVVSSVLGAVEDVTDELAANRRIASHIAASEALDHWQSLETGGPGLLRAVAEALEFHAAALWVPEVEDLCLRAFWIADAEGSREFAAATRNVRLRRDVGLAGKVWHTGEAINVADVQTYAPCMRRDAAARAGLRGAVAFPALRDGEVLAVVELHCRERARLSRRLMQSLGAIGSELGVSCCCRGLVNAHFTAVVVGTGR